MKSILKAGAILASALALAACGQDDAVRNDAAAAPAGNQAAPAGDAAAGNAAQAPGTAEPAAAAQQDFSVVNNSGHTVMTLNVSASDEDEWGPDILGAEVLADGETATVSFERGQDQCLWDIRVTYDDGDSGDMRGVNLCEVATVTLTP